MQDLRRLGIEPVSPAMKGGYFTTEPAGKPVFIWIFFFFFGITFDFLKIACKKHIKSIYI